MKKSKVYIHLEKALDYLIEASAAASDEEIKLLIEKEASYLRKPLKMYLKKLRAKNE